MPGAACRLCPAPEAIALLDFAQTGRGHPAVELTYFLLLSGNVDVPHPEPRLATAAPLLVSGLTEEQLMRVYHAELVRPGSRVIAVQYPLVRLQQDLDAVPLGFALGVRGALRWVVQPATESIFGAQLCSVMSW